MSKMTIAFEIEDKDSPLVKKLMESFIENKSIDGVKVYAASHECLFDEVEKMEAELMGEDY